MRHSTLPSGTHEILRILLNLFPVLGIEESYRCQMTSNRGELGAIGHSGGVIKSVVLSIGTYLVWGETYSCDNDRATMDPSITRIDVYQAEWDRIY